VLLPIAIAFVVAGGLPFTIFIAVIAVFALLELYTMGREWIYRGNRVIGIVAALIIIVGFHSDEAALWQAALALGLLIALVWELARTPDAASQAVLRAATTLGAVVYIAIPAAFVILLRALPDGLTWLLTALVLTWVTDSFAYFGGRRFGQHKLAPRISPKKTVEGAVAGFIGGTIAGVVVLVAGGIFTVSALPLLILAPVVATIGDLFESAIKRYFAVKDSHLPSLDLMPGHGGVLDRVDSLLFVTAFVYLYIEVFNLM